MVIAREALVAVDVGLSMLKQCCPILPTLASSRQNTPPPCSLVLKRIDVSSRDVDPKGSVVGFDVSLGVVVFPLLMLLGMGPSHVLRVKGQFH